MLQLLSLEILLVLVWLNFLFLFLLLFRLLWAFRGFDCYSKVTNSINCWGTLGTFRATRSGFSFCKELWYSRLFFLTINFLFAHFSCITFKICQSFHKFFEKFPNLNCFCLLFLNLKDNFIYSSFGPTNTAQKSQNIGIFGLNRPGRNVITIGS